MGHHGKTGNGPRHTLKNNLYIMGLVWKISQSRVVLSFLHQFLDYGFWVFNTVVFMRYLFGAEDLNMTFTQVALFLVCSIAGWMLFQLFSSWFLQRYKAINDPQLYSGLNSMLFDKATNVELHCFENKEFYNTYTKASSEVFQKAVSVIDQNAKLIMATLASVFIIGNLFSINVWFGVFSAIPIVTNLVMGMKSGSLDYKRSMAQIPFARRQDYVNRVVYLQQYTKDIRLTNIFSVLTDTYHKATAERIAVIKKIGVKMFIFNFFKSFLVFAVYFQGTWLLGAYFAMVQESITLSDFVVSANSAISTTWMLFDITGGIVAAYTNSLYVDNLKAFLEYEEKIPENQPGLSVPKQIDTLELRNVSFRYYENAPFVLQDISLILRQGEIASLVGQNGSGKSTLVKLILRLYDPTEGTILLNGCDIRKYDLQQYRALIGATFQDYRIFSVSIKENVIMGNDILGEEQYVSESALRKSGVYDAIITLPKGMDTVLTREFDGSGAVLSGGGEQKVAVARAFAKKSAILLLDEPSSALDPIAEYQMFCNFISLCRGGKDGRRKISIFISHRLSSSAIADKVYLLSNGKIIERGNHRSLMKQNGVYAGMFRKQAKNYRLGVEGE